MRQPDWFEFKKHVDEMRQAAKTISVLAYFTYTSDPNKNIILEKIKYSADEILECLDFLETPSEESE
jgi:hypothetical protein